jgi:hypothetical protein
VLAAALVTVGSGLALGGCLGCGKTFSAEGFVDEANSHGAGIELGRELPAGQSGKKTYAVELSRKPGDPVLPGTTESAGGSMTVFSDSDAAEKATEACEVAGDLLCYQAGNVGLVFEGGAPDIAQTRLAAAIQEMAD